MERQFLIEARAGFEKLLADETVLNLMKVYFRLP